MSFGHDPDAFYQDADIEMMELADAADRLCPTCGGSGKLHEHDAVWSQCPTCKGTGDTHD